MGIELDVYSGILSYKDIDFDFVFDKKELRLIPPKDKQDDTYKWFLKEISTGVYTFGEPLYIEERYLEGITNETGQTIIFFPSSSQIGNYNSVLTISIGSYILKYKDIDSIDTVGFKSAEIDHIFSTNQALCYPNWNEDGQISIQTTKFSEDTSEKQKFSVDGKTVTVSFGITRTTRIKEGEPPLQLHSVMYFEFDKTDDYSFVIDLWYIAKAFIQYLCYRKNVRLPQVEILSHLDNGNNTRVATLYSINDNDSVELETLSKGRYIKQSYISGYEGKILEDIANDTLYQRHIPASYKQGRSIDAARFVMITAAFEWEFRRCYPDGIPKKKGTVEVETKATNEIDALISKSTGKLKDIYKYLRGHITNKSLQSEIVQVGKDYSTIIDVFGKRLCSLNNEVLNYNEMGKRLGDQRNNFAHGNLDKEFIGNSLLDLIFLEYIIYAMQLKRYGIPDENIQHIINDLFHCLIALN